MRKRIKRDLGYFSEGNVLVPRHVRDYHKHAEVLLIVESHSMLQSLIMDDWFRNLPQKCLVLSGCGYPDRRTVEVVRHLVEFRSENGSSLPVYIFTDTNPHGCRIAVPYMGGISCSDVTWMGPLLPDCSVRYTRNESCVAPLTVSDVQIAVMLPSELFGNLDVFPSFCASMY